MTPRAVIHRSVVSGKLYINTSPNIQQYTHKSGYLYKIFVDKYIHKEIKYIAQVQIKLGH